MFGLLENGLATIALGDLELIPALTVVADVSCLCDIGQGKDIRDPFFAEPHIAKSRESSTQLRDCFSGLGVDGQAPAHFPNVLEKVGV